MFIFGLTADEVEQTRRAALHRPRRGRRVRRGLPTPSTASRAGMFSPGEPDRFRALVEALLAYDHFMVAADFDAYWEAQRAVDALWRTARLVADRASSTRRGWAGSRPTARSANMRTDDLATSTIDVTRRDITMQALFIGQTYIDVTFLDRSHAERRREVGRLRIRGLVRRQRRDRGVLLRQARRSSRT